MRPETANIASAKVGDSILVIMAMVRPGAVKTRLAARLSSDAITGLYRCLLEDTIDLARSLDGVENAIMGPAADVEDLRCVADGSMQVVAQRRAGLAAGLESVFDYFSVEGQRRIIAFNSDSPHLPVLALRQAFEALDSHDLAVGPTRDGGYYLVGAKASHPGLFAPSVMGTTSALAALLACAQRVRLSVHTTDQFYDIDVPADLSRLAEELRLAPERAPRTARWLGDWGQTAEQLLAAGPNL
jgi:rSAM/selenodomain-associated transferase 1